MKMLKFNLFFCSAMPLMFKDGNCFGAIDREYHKATVIKLILFNHFHGNKKNDMIFCSSATISLFKPKAIVTVGDILSAIDEIVLFTRAFKFYFLFFRRAQRINCLLHNA